MASLKALGEVVAKLAKEVKELKEAGKIAAAKKKEQLLAQAKKNYDEAKKAQEAKKAEKKPTEPKGVKPASSEEKLTPELLKILKQKQAEHLKRKAKKQLKEEGKTSKKRNRSKRKKTGQSATTRKITNGTIVRSGGTSVESLKGGLTREKLVLKPSNKAQVTPSATTKNKVKGATKTELPTPPPELPSTVAPKEPKIPEPTPEVSGGQKPPEPTVDDNVVDINGKLVELKEQHQQLLNAIKQESEAERLRHAEDMAALNLKIEELKQLLRGASLAQKLESEYERSRSIWRKGVDFIRGRLSPEKEAEYLARRRGTNTLDVQENPNARSKKGKNKKAQTDLTLENQSQLSSTLPLALPRRILWETKKNNFGPYWKFANGVRVGLSPWTLPIAYQAVGRPGYAVLSGLGHDAYEWAKQVGDDLTEEFNPNGYGFLDIFKRNPSTTPADTTAVSTTPADTTAVSTAPADTTAPVNTNVSDTTVTALDSDAGASVLDSLVNAQMK